MKKQNNTKLFVRYSILACAGLLIVSLVALSYDFTPPQVEQVRHVGGSLQS
jgi:hypothetical protein